jgi:hypothetical protein
LNEYLNIDKDVTSIREYRFSMNTRWHGRGMEFLDAQLVSAFLNGIGCLFQCNLNAHTRLIYLREVSSRQDCARFIDHTPFTRVERVDASDSRIACC